jgi:hypothetical protein
MEFHVEFGRSWQRSRSLEKSPRADRQGKNKKTISKGKIRPCQSLYVAARFGKPKIMLLKDYNGDGEALEFALFDAWTCSDLVTTLIGYSRR